MKLYHLSISGLHCEACVKLVSKRLAKLEGVDSVSGDENGRFELNSNKTVQKNDINTLLAGTEYSLATFGEA